MLTPRLVIPTKFATTPPLAVEARPDRLAAWLGDLPRANPFESLRALHDVLFQFNRIDIPYAKRLALAEAMRPRIAELVPPVRRDYIDTQLPLSARKQQRHELVQQSWAEMANAYKLTLMELLLTESEILDPTAALIPAIYQAVTALAEQICDSYVIYAEEPSGAWSELHQLFHFAQVNSIADMAYALTNAETTRQVTVGRAYRRALLLALADPYHLTPGEVVRVAQELELWDALCDAVAISKEMTIGRFCVDPEQDVSPRYIADPDQFAATRSSWTVDLSRAVELVGKRTRATMETGPQIGGKAAPSTLAQRQSRELYRRLAQAWTPRRPRKSMRTPTAQQLSITTGLSAAHHVASGAQLYQPEIAEVTLSGRASAPSKTPSLTLEKLASTTRPPPAPSPGLRSARLARFDRESAGTQPDVWDKTYRTESSDLLVQRTEEAAIEQPSAIATVRDISPQGLSVDLALPGLKIHTRVGDLVAVVATDPQQSPQTTAPCKIGAVRWLRTTSGKGLELGIEILSDDALPVATRAVDGVGKGGEYFRALIVPRRDPADRQTTLLTMPSIYDVGTILVLNTGQKLYRARLTRLLEGAGAFARFQYDVVDTSPSLGLVS